jgi:DNA-binding response OmpR family regulator
LPDGNGVDFQKELRKKRHIPVLFLTALSGYSDVLNALHAGGGDYIVKPYDNYVLSSRIEAMLARTNPLR